MASRSNKARSVEVAGTGVDVTGAGVDLGGVGGSDGLVVLSSTAIGGGFDGVVGRLGLDTAGAGVGVVGEDDSVVGLLGLAAAVGDSDGAATVIGVAGAVEPVISAGLGAAGDGATTVGVVGADDSVVTPMDPVGPGAVGDGAATGAGAGVIGARVGAAMSFAELNVSLSTLLSPPPGIRMMPPTITFATMRSEMTTTANKIFQFLRTQSLSRQQQLPPAAFLVVVVLFNGSLFHCSSPCSSSSAGLGLSR